MPAPSTDPVSNTLRREDSVELYAAVVALPQQQRAVSSGIVDVFIAIDIPLTRTVGVRDVDAVRFDVAHVMGDAAGKHLAGTIGERGR